MLWSPDAKNWLIGKNPDSGKAWRQEEKGMTVDEMVGRHHRLSGHKFEQVLGPGDREARRAAVYGVAKSRTQLSSWTECIHEYTNVYDKSLIHYNLQLQSCVLVYDLEESGIETERERERERENELQLKCMLGKPLKTCTWKSRQSPNLQINIWELPLWTYRSFLFFSPSVAYHQVFMIWVMPVSLSVPLLQFIIWIHWTTCDIPNVSCFFDMLPGMNSIFSSLTIIPRKLLYLT